jgi:HAD superfamily hydrolase (TIGR01549 family)
MFKSKLIKNKNINKREIPIKHEIDLLMFDLDGTLVDSLDGVIFALEKTFDHLNLPRITKEKLISFIGVSVSDMLTRCTNIPHSSEEFKQIYTTFKEYFNQFANKHSRLYPNTVHILDHFSHKRKIIVTNRKHDIASLTLSHFKLHDYFDIIIGSDDATCVKPSGCPIEKALTRFQCLPERAAIIGDMDIDVYAGKDAGVITCAIRGGIGLLDDLIKSDPDYLINDLAQLKDLFV